MDAFHAVGCLLLKIVYYLRAPPRHDELYMPRSGKHVHLICGALCRDSNRYHIPFSLIIKGRLRGSRKNPIVSVSGLLTEARDLITVG